MTIANLDKRLALTEQKLDTVIDDIAEIKSDMKQHIDSTTSATEKIRSRTINLELLLYIYFKIPSDLPFSDTHQPRTLRNVGFAL